MAAAVMVLLALHIAASHGQLLVHFYDSSCPRAESIVAQTVTAAAQTNPGAPAQLLRLFFHDCFVRGSDASILLDSTTNNTAEKGATASATLDGFGIIDQAKETLETVCPGTVSCADILALAARDAVVATGGPSFDMPTGRFDGLISLASEVIANIPDPSLTLDQVLAVVQGKGLSPEDLVILLGSHTIGSAHCGAFGNRFSFNNGSMVLDPTLDPTFAQSLLTVCPLNSSNPATTVPLDAISSTKFDNAYYIDLLQGKGLLTADEELFTDMRTKSLVQTFAQDSASFFGNFPLALVKMGSIGLKTAADGQIRKNCRFVNPQ